MNFNEKQTEAIFSRGNIALLASSGSGKTAVIIERIASLIKDGVSPENILSITFSKQAADNLKTRLEVRGLSGVNTCTLHGLGYQILKSAHTRIKLFDQLWEKEKVIFDSLTRHGEFYDEKEDVNFQEIFNFISAQKNHLIGENDTCVKTKTESLTYSVLSKIYKDYETHKRENNLIDFDDMINLAVKLLTENSLVYEFFTKKYKYILVDETQDISYNQFELIRILNTDNQLFMVGDPKQSIYRFRYSDPKFLVNMHEYFPDTKYINMNINYRSSQDIVTLSNSIAAYDSISKDKNYVPAVSDKGVLSTPVYTRYLTEIFEEKDIVDKIKNFVENKDYKYSDISILARTNAELQRFEACLYNNDIPYQTYNGKCFLDNPEIDLLMSYIKLSQDDYDNDSFIKIYNKPNRYLGREFIKCISGMENKSLVINTHNVKEYKKYKHGANDLLNVISELKTRNFTTVGEMVKYLRKRLELDELYSSYSEDDSKLDSLNRFTELCSRFTTVQSFLYFANNIKANTGNKRKDKIHLMTAHKSKGLEYKIVFVTGLNENQFPHAKAIDDKKDIETELRLFYVACTRAEEYLFISSANKDGNKPSRFISCIVDSADFKNSAG